MYKKHVIGGVRVKVLLRILGIKEMKRFKKVHPVSHRSFLGQSLRIAEYAEDGVLSYTQ